jgi:hypothetical protein
MLSLEAHGKTTKPIDSSDMTYDPVKKRWSIKWPDGVMVGVETGWGLLQETGKKIELEVYFKAIYRRQPTPRGRIIIREKYYACENPQHTDQQIWRGKFATAVSLWQALSSTEQIVWNKILYPNHMSGYNRFIRNYLKTA